MRLNFDRKIVFILITVFAALLLRILYMAQFADSPLFGIPIGADVQEYDRWAREIFSGRILWVEPQIHAPLYPFFLVALYSLFKMDYLYLIPKTSISMRKTRARYTTATCFRFLKDLIQSQGESEKQIIIRAPWRRSFSMM